MKLLPVGYLFGAVALAGCSLAPDRVRPAFPVPDDWALADPTTATAARPTEWHQFFAAPALDTLITSALANSRDLRIAIWHVEVTRGEYRVQSAEGLPQIGGDADALRTQLPPALSPTGSRVTENIYAGHISASRDVDLCGRIRNRDAAGLRNFIASDEARGAVTLSLIADVANTWLSGRELDERIALARQTMASRRESARIPRRRYQVGAAPRIDAAQAAALPGDAESTSITLEQQREQNRIARTILVGAPSEPTVILLLDFEGAVVHDPPSELPSALLAQRPDIRGAENRLQASGQEIGSARAAFFPNISLIGDGGIASTALNKLFIGKATLWAFGSSLTGTIFDGGRLRGELNEAKANPQLAIADYERTVQTAFRDDSRIDRGGTWRKGKYDRHSDDGGGAPGLRRPGLEPADRWL